MPETPNIVYYFSDGRSHLYRSVQNVRIQAVTSVKVASWMEPKCNHIRIDYTSDLLGDQTLMLATIDSTALTPADFTAFWRRAFVASTQPDTFSYYARNEHSGLVHSSLCDHVSATSEFTFLRELPQGDSIRMCPICFRRSPKIPDQGIESYIGMLAEMDYLSYHRLSSNQELLRHVDSLGKIVLRHWPMPLRGYNYHFYLVEDASPNSLACPGGSIYINSGLLDATERDDEILAVLAHEVAHVEFRHGLRQYRSAQKAEIWGSIASVLAGGIVAAASNDAESGIVASQIASAVSDVFTTIAIAGYSREYELEADQIASLFSARYLKESPPIGYEAVLKKLRYYDGENPITALAAADATHPTTTERLAAIEQSKLTYYDTPIEYTGSDDFGNPVARFSILAVSIGPAPLQTMLERNRESPSDRFEYVCYGELRTTNYLPAATRVKHFQLRDVPEQFDNKQDTRIGPEQVTGLVFRCDSADSLALDSLLLCRDLWLEMGGAKKWERLSSQQ